MIAKFIKVTPIVDGNTKSVYVNTSEIISFTDHDVNRGAITMDSYDGTFETYTMETADQIFELIQKA